MAYSTIKKKSCKCGCGKPYTISCNGYNYNCAPADIKEKLGTRKQLSIKNKNARLRAASKLRGDDDTVKRTLLMKADKVFGDFIKERDSNEHGNIICVCCNQNFNVEDKDGANGKIVQPLHFVSRGTYSLRFSEENVYAGCCYCNLDMYLHPEGKSVLNYQNKLIDKLGIVEVMRMQAERRKLHKVSTSDLQEIIKKYNDEKTTPATKKEKTNTLP